MSSSLSLLAAWTLLLGPAAQGPRPTLQVINGSAHPLQVDWLAPDGERVSNGTVAPGGDTVITTTLGHRFALHGQPDAPEVVVTSAVPLQAVRYDPPDSAGIPAFYAQRVSAGGFPIVASARVDPYALAEAAYLVDLMLAERPDVRAALVASGARLCIQAWNEFTTDLPEFARLGARPLREFPGLPGKDYWDARARGLGGSERDPFCSCAEENLLGYPGDPYAAECILIHEFAHCIHLRGMSNVDPTFDGRVKAAYDAAMAQGLWRGKYASVNHHEYFAEGVQSWFDDNRFDDHDHNHVHLRAQLVEYDPRLAALCREVFGATELRYTKPATRLHGHLAGYDPSAAPTFAWPERLAEAHRRIGEAARARAAGAEHTAQLERKAERAATRPPNVVLILADDLGYGDLGRYNAAAKVATPHLDRLAAEGLCFTDAHSPATVCTPTRYSLLTGQMAFRVPRGGTVFTGVGGPSLIAPGRPTLASLLRGAGYATAAVGKWHVGLTFRDAAGQPVEDGGLEAVRRVDFSRPFEGGPLAHGFERFFGTACCPTTDWLYAYLDGDRVPAPPVAIVDRSALPRHPYADDCRPGLVAPDFNLEEVDLVFLERSKAFLEEHLRTAPERPFFLYHATQAVHLPSFAAPRFKGATEAGPHGDFIHELDWIVGELLATLERLGVADDTLVVFTSDNGPETTSVVHMRRDHGHDGARPWRGMKRDNWEGGHRVPLLVRWPGKVAPGTTSDQLVSLTDVLATVAAAVGVDLPDDAAEDSFDLLPVLLGQAQGPIRPYLVTQAFGGAQTLAIRRGRWKYLDHPGSGGNRYLGNSTLAPYALPETAPDAPAQLYDLERDPGETTNLYAEHPALVAELRGLLEASRAAGRSAPRRR